MAPPPPVTPSPHRFLFSKPNQPKKPAITPLHATPSIDPAQSTQGTSSQFARVPRFAAPHATPSREAARSPSPPRLHFAPPGNAEGDAVQDVVTSQDSDDEMLDTGPVMPTIELADDLSEPTKTTLNSLPYSPKRRRLSPVDDNVAVPSPRHNHTPARFIIPSAAEASQISSSTQTQSSRPSFRRTFLPPQIDTSEPLPDAFSPHRRGQRFVPGGLAAEVQSWIVEGAAAAVQSRRGQGDDWVHRLQVASVRGQGPLFVQGHAGDEEVRAVLVDGGESARVRGGHVVGIRAPTWHVEVGGETWIVGVDWRIIR